jgi:hypothetical protein
LGNEYSIANSLSFEKISPKIAKKLPKFSATTAYNLKG